MPKRKWKSAAIWHSNYCAHTGSIHHHIIFCQIVCTLHFFVCTALNISTLCSVDKLQFCLHRTYTCLHCAYTCLHRTYTCLHRTYTCLHCMTTRRADNMLLQSVHKKREMGSRKIYPSDRLFYSPFRVQRFAVTLQPDAHYMCNHLLLRAGSVQI